MSKTIKPKWVLVPAFGDCPFRIVRLKVHTKQTALCCTQLNSERDIPHHLLLTIHWLGRTDRLFSLASELEKFACGIPIN
jgi:hypothetical protein